MKGFLCYFNGYFNLYLYAKEIEWTLANIDKKIEGNRTWRLTRFEPIEDQIFYTFGVFDSDATMRPGHGGEWSSRAACILKRFNIRLYETSINNIALSIPIEDVYKYINPKVFKLIDELDSDHGTTIISEVISSPVYKQWYDSDGNPIDFKDFLSTINAIKQDLIQAK